MLCDCVSLIADMTLVIFLIPAIKSAIPPAIIIATSFPESELLEPNTAGTQSSVISVNATKKTAGVKNAVVNFMALKMEVEFEEGADPKAVMKDVLANCKKVEDDCEIYL